MARENERIAPDLTRFLMKGAKGESVNFDRLAREMGMSSVVLSRVMRGHRVMAPEKYRRLEAILNVTISERHKDWIQDKIDEVVKKRKEEWQSPQP